MTTISLLSLEFNEFLEKINENRSEYVKFTGPYYKNNKFGEYSKELNQFIIKTALGDKWGNNTDNFSTDIIFINNNNLKDREYIVRNYPNIHTDSTNMTIEVNFDDITIHLLIQRIINNFKV